MNSNTFEPRQVEPNAIMRWAKQSAELIARGPLSFICLVVICPVLEKIAEVGDYSDNYCQFLGGILMPFIFGAGILAARVSDVGRHQARAREILNDKRVWLYIGCTVLASLFLTLIDFSVIRIVSRIFPHQIILSIIASLTCFSFGDGLFVLPLILLSSLSFGHSWKLSDQGMNINFISIDNLSFSFSSSALQYFAIMSALPIALCLLPAYGIPGSICVCYLSAFVYVGYRDIFERRDANQPRQSATQERSVLVAANQTI